MIDNRDIGVKPPREIDSVDRVLYFKSFLKIFVPAFIIFSLLFGPVKGFFIGLFFGAVGAVIVLFFADKFGGDFSKLIYGGRHTNIPLREQLESELKAVKVAKMNKEFKAAIDMVNSILDKDPEFYEAMFVKAQILDEGFDKTASAIKYAQKVVENTQEGETLNTWAASLYKEISERGEQ